MPELKLRADIPIVIRRIVIRIELTDPCIDAIIPITACEKDTLLHFNLVYNKTVLI